jgi:hypothetical protein
MECWVRSFVACYGLRVASHALQRLVCNILTRYPQRKTRNTSISTLWVMLRQFSNLAH